MSDAKRDENRISVSLGISNIDGATPVMLTADPTTHILNTIDGSDGSDLSGANASRDGNRVTCLMGVSSADGKTPVALYVDSLGNLLIKSS